MKSIFSISISSFALFSLFFAGCAEIESARPPKETTGIGAAAGGILGAGLGAIVGSQTGDAGTGVAIGAVAGASAGGAIGYSMEGQQEKMRAQDEAIERQDKLITAQNTEIQELKNIRPEGAARAPRSLDELPVREKRVTGPITGASKPMAAIPPRQAVREPVIKESYAKLEPAPVVEAAPVHQAAPIAKFPDSTSPQAEGVIAEKEIIPPQPKIGLGAYNWDQEKPIQEGMIKPVPAKLNDTLQSEECRSASVEAEKAEKTTEVSERLFHYRRALRLCPDNARFHNELGEIYLSLNRSADAEFEFSEATKLDPNYEAAKSNLAALKTRSQKDVIR